MVTTEADFLQALFDGIGDPQKQQELQTATEQGEITLATPLREVLSSLDLEEVLIKLSEVNGVELQSCELPPDPTFKDLYRNSE